jgi:WD40 repeat protein
MNLATEFRSWGRPLRAALLLALLVSVSEGPLQAQAGCEVPSLLPGVRAPNIFSDQQEVDLGDAIAEQIQHNFRITSDPELTAYLQRVGGRLLKHLPPQHLAFRYYLVDLSEPNAFSIAGGRVYISNKIVALAHNEDELASVLAHEFGHIVTHQTALQVTRQMKEVLGVSEVADRRDIFQKYHLLIENRRRKQASYDKARKRSEEEQEVADRVGLVALTRAGYSPQAFVDIFDRATGSEGKTGSWFSDLFGATPPEARRLREMIKGVGTLPEDCVERAPAGSLKEFKKWQAAVVSYSGWEQQEALHGVLAKVRLQPQLQSTIRTLKFSPDGKYILAQDDATIFVLSRDPLQPLFKMEAPDTAPALFTPDSKAVTVNSQRLRVETWDIAGAKRTSAHEVPVPKGCLQTTLAPDGKTLACLGTGHDLMLVDVGSGAEVFRAPGFFKAETPFLSKELWNLLFAELGALGSLVRMGFSPDARYFLAASRGEAVAYDLSRRETVRLPASVGSHLYRTFAFLGPDRLVAAGRSQEKHVPILRFPSGEKLGEIDLGIGQPSAATHGDYVLVRPVQGYGVGVFDFRSGKGLLANKNPALDVYDNVVVREQRDGEPALYDLKTGKQLARVELSGGSLGKLKALAVSPDFKWLAVSGAERGAVWNLADGKRLYLTRAFRGAYFAEDGNLYADFPKYEQTERSIVRVRLDRQELTPIIRVSERFADSYGPFLLVSKPDKPEVRAALFGPIDSGLDRKVTWETRDARTGQTLWSRYFSEEVPSVFAGPREGTMVLMWAATAKAVHDETQNNPQLRERLRGAKLDRSDYLLEVVEARSGKYLGSLLVDTGQRSFIIQAVLAAGDWVVITDNQNRTLLYSLSSGAEKGRFFGTLPTILPEAELLALQNEHGHLSLYDLSTTELVDQFVFPSHIVCKLFAADGSRLFVLTADQTAYTLGLAM